MLTAVVAAPHPVRLTVYHHTPQCVNTLDAKHTQEPVKGEVQTKTDMTLNDMMLNWTNRSLIKVKRPFWSGTITLSRSGITCYSKGHQKLSQLFSRLVKRLIIPWRLCQCIHFQVCRFHSSPIISRSKRNSLRVEGHLFFYGLKLLHGLSSMILFFSAW